MIAVYLRYNGEIRHTDEQGRSSLIPAGSERHLIDCTDEEHAAKVVASWLRDSDTITVRTVRRQA